MNQRRACSSAAGDNRQRNSETTSFKLRRFSATLRWTQGHSYCNHWSVPKRLSNLEGNCMKLTTNLILFFLALLFTSVIVAQDSNSAADTAAKLRLQLIEVQTKEGELRARLQQLDEDLRPGNIERALAGIGSTHPEELREHRRRQLTIEKNGVLAQLKTLEAS